MNWYIFINSTLIMSKFLVYTPSYLIFYCDLLSYSNVLVQFYSSDANCLLYRSPPRKTFLVCDNGLPKGSYNWEAQRD